MRKAWIIAGAVLLVAVAAFAQSASAPVPTSAAITVAPALPAPGGCTERAGAQPVIAALGSAAQAAAVCSDPNALAGPGSRLARWQPQPMASPSIWCTQCDQTGDCFPCCRCDGGGPGYCTILCYGYSS